ncbi:MAG: hypothetical protein J6S20_04540 [Paludibacteraceae bacterium]|nr:hypothetical protein [Paludibacteraceae bacterium]
MKKKLFIVAIFLSLSTSLFAKQISLAEGEEKLNALFQKLKKEESDSIKSCVNDSICQFFSSLLQKKNTFEYPFQELKYIGKRIAKDRKVAIYTWSYPENGGAKYSGIVQQKTPKGVRVFPLKQATKAYAPKEIGTISTQNWYGALYFDIVPFRSKHGKVYMLLGIAQNKQFLTMKVIDVLWFEEEKAFLGMPIFEFWKKDFLHRIVFEYNEDISITLLYEKENKRFVFDHLEPVNSGFVGDYRYYVPNSTYDAYKKNVWKWALQEDVIVGE